MQEYQTKPKATLNGERANRIVELFVQSNRYQLEGSWHWDLHSNVVYCSDVIQDVLPQFEGTKGIIHPDDFGEVMTAITGLEKDQLLTLTFRMITTYGEVKTLAGQDIRLVTPTEENDPLEKVLEEVRDTQVLEKDRQAIQLQRAASQYAERMTETGSWYYNASSGKAWYSDHVYRLHGLLPQSLNAHLHTFFSFIHPDDHAIVTEAIDSAIIQQIPLQVTYRIVLPNDEERFVQLNIGWQFSERGELVLYGLFQDLTDQKNNELAAEATDMQMGFQRQLLQFTENATNTGYWQLHLVTRKIVLSDNYYRIFGLKPQSVPASSAVFMNYIHPDDRELYAEVMRKIRKEHIAPEVEYRIVRPDGKIRFVRQKGKAIAKEEEIVMIGTLQDITIQKSLEKKVGELQESIHVKSFMSQQAEAIARVGNWMWDLKTGEITWSDSLYELLGLKSNVIKLTLKLFKGLIHPEDLKYFNEEVNLAVSEKKESEFTFRLVTKGVTMHLKAFFRILSHEQNEFFTAILQDITNEAVIKTDLTERIRLIELLSDSIADQVIVTDTSNNVVLWNKSCELAYDTSRDKALGHNLFDIIPLFKDQPILSSLNMALEGERVQLRNVQPIPALKGNYDVSLAPLFDENKHVVGVLHMIRNVTREHRLHLELTQRLQFIEKLLQATVDRIVVLDRNMNYQYFNKRAEEFYGLNKVDIIGKNILETFPRNQKVPSYAQLREALKGQTVHIPADDNDPFGYNETYLIPIKGEKEDVTGVLWIVHDLTKEYHLLQEQKKAARILDTIMELYIEVDEAGNLTYVNKQAEENWGKKKEDLIGRNLWEVFPEARDSGGYQIINRALAEKAKVQDEYYSKVLNKWVFMSAMPSAAGLVVIFYDITDVKQAREKLEYEHFLLKEAQELGRIGSFEWDRFKDAIYWSDEMYRIHGLEPQSEVVTLDRVLSFVDQDYMPWPAEELAKCRQEACSFDLIHGIRRTDGALRMVRRKIESFADENGVVTHLRGTLQDITDQVEAQKKLEEREALLRTAEEVAFTGSFEVDFATLTFRFSDGMFRLLGEAPQSFEPSLANIESKLHPDDTGVIRQVLKQAAIDKQPFNYTHRVYRRDGALRTLEAHGRVMFDGHGHATHCIALVQDITEKKIAEQELTESKAFAESVALATPDLITIHDAITNQIIYTNNHLFWKKNDEESKVIYELEDGLRAEAMVHPDDVQKAKDFLKERRLLEDGEVKEIELRMNGKIEWIRIKSRVFKRDDKGRATQIISFTTDISESKKAAVEIQKNITILTHAEDLAQIGSWEYDIKTGSFSWSEGMYHLFGLPQGTAVTPEIYLNYATEEDRSIAKQFIKKIRKQHESFEDTIRIRRGEEVRILKIKSSVVNNEKGQADKIIGVDVDITEILDIEEKLQETKYWLQQTALTSPDSITIYDVTKKQPIYLNECLASWLETTSEELIAMGIEGRLSLIHPDDRLKLLHFNELTIMAKDDKVHRTEYRIRTKSDKVIWLRNRSKVFQRNKEGKVTHLLSILEDITAEKEAENKLLELNASLEEKNRILERKNEEITSFAFIASHDLKEPLRKMHTFSDWLMEQEQEHLTTKGRAYLERMKAAVERMDLLIEDVLVLAKINSDTGRIETVDLKALIENVVKELPRPDAVIHYPGSWPTIKGNKNQVFYLLHNLLENALKFQKPGSIPEIVIQFKKVSGNQVHQKDVSPEKRYLQLSIKDNGLGFEEQYASKIFQVFQRLHQQQEFEGTGIGLAICKKIMENHNGFITAESKKGEGATFYCYFPIVS